MSKTPYLQYLFGFARHGKTLYHYGFIVTITPNGIIKLPTLLYLKGTDCYLQSRNHPRYPPFTSQHAARFYESLFLPFHDLYCHRHEMQRGFYDYNLVDYLNSNLLIASTVALILQHCFLLTRHLAVS